MVAEHTRISPSMLRHLKQCPGSLRFVESLDLPPQPLNNTEAAAEGIRLHEEMASTPTSPLALAAQDMRNQLTFHSNAFASVFKELSVNILALPTEIKGTLDFAHYDPEKAIAHVVDYKFGYREIKAENNLQLLAYAIGLANYIRPYGEIENWYLTIIQPRCKTTPDTWHVKNSVIVQAFHDILDLTQIAVADDYMLQLKPQVDVCTFCRGAPYCPALKKRSHETAATLFTKELSTDTMFNVFSQIPLLEQYIDIVTKQVRKHLLEHGPSHGYKIERTRGRRRWKTQEHDLENAELVRILTHAGVDPYDKSLKSPAKIFAELKDPEVREWVEDFVEYGEGKTLKIVPEDKKTADTAKNVFAAYRQVTN